jgi:hypothetical protein
MSYDWNTNPNNYKFELFNCEICGQETKRITNYGDEKRSKRTCGRPSCTNRLALLTTSHTVECVGCKKEFVSLRKHTKYCGEECRVFRYKLTCVICNEEFNSKKSDTKTCSHKCRWALNKQKKITLECKECGVEFERPSFSVADKDNVFCSKECCNIYFVQEHYGTFNRYGENWYFIKKEIRSIYGDECQRCFGHFKQLHVHHCVPFKYFETHEKANVIDNLIPLCEDCHTEVHRLNREWYKQTFGKVKI